jgi:PDZ domain-containing protein
VKVTALRGKDTKAQDITVTLAQREDGKAILGIIPGVPNTVHFEFPFNVDIGTGDIGGPSAGLAWTIATLDALTPGSITGGRKVAITGTIDVYGNVGQIGGLRQKTIAVIRAGADLFIVPKAEIADAQKAAVGSRLRVVGVETLDDALKVLADEGGNALTLPKQAAA